MNDLLTRKEIRDICLENGFSVKPQPDGADDLNPYVYAAAHALIERALKSVLIVHQRSKTAMLKLGPNSTLDIPQYETICSQYAIDFKTLESLMDKLQASLVQRQVNSTKLWNMSVVDKHGELIYGVTSQRLGPAMHNLIEGVKAAIAPFKNEPLIEQPNSVQTLESLQRLCAEKGVVLDIPVQVLGQLKLSNVEINTHGLDACIRVALTVLNSPLYLDKYPTNQEPFESVVADFRFDRGRYYISPVFESYDTIHCSEWAEDWSSMSALAEFCNFALTVSEEGKFTTVELNGVRFTSMFASSAMRYANCYLGHEVLAAAEKDRGHA